ncbi:MAG: hypothetical protein ACYCT1_11240 [Steroidobacteraceae bacterium]
MHRRYILSVLATAIIVFSGTYLALRPFGSGMPFSIQVESASTAKVAPVPGVSIPEALQPGTRIDLAAQPSGTRIAMVRAIIYPNLPAGRTHIVMVRRGHTVIATPVTTVQWTQGSRDLLDWAIRGSVLLLAAIALIAVWLGRDRAAKGLALWGVAFLMAESAVAAPSDHATGLSVLLVLTSLFLLARVGFYIMAESIVGTALSATARIRWRASFFFMLLLGVIESIGGPLVYIATGWAELLRPAYGVALTGSYLVPIGLLLASYRSVSAPQRLRLRWMLGSSVVLITGVLFVNDPVILGYLSSLIVSQWLIAMAMAGFLYAVVRHRVVDLVVILNRALVYATTMSLLLGLLALMESVIERQALGHRASLILELAVPLGLGAALSTVHGHMENLVERLVFRRQYREEVALRSFARECAYITEPDRLLDLTVEQVGLHAEAPWVAIYERWDNGYLRIRQHGRQDLALKLERDDLAFVKLRAHAREVDLHVITSGLGQEGHAFPLMARGELLGALVVGPRSEERYAAEERELFEHIAHEVGASLFALRLQTAEERARETVTSAKRQTEAILEEARIREARLLELLHAQRIREGT